MINESDEIRPCVSIGIDINEFERWYWPVEELKKFCDLLAISKVGRKSMLRDRVAAALSGEEPPTERLNKRPKYSSFNWSKETLNGLTVITESITFGRNVRGFFKEEIGPRFVCHSDFMEWVKANPGRTLQDAVAAWELLEARKDDPEFRRDIAECNNYLRYLRDIRDDNPKMTLDHAKLCWDQKKIRPAENGFVVYSCDDLRFLEESNRQNDSARPASKST